MAKEFIKPRVEVSTSFIGNDGGHETPFNQFFFYYNYYTIDGRSLECNRGDVSSEGQKTFIKNIIAPYLKLYLEAVFKVEALETLKITKQNCDKNAGYLYCSSKINSRYANGVSNIDLVVFLTLRMDPENRDYYYYVVQRDSASKRPIASIAYDKL